MIAAFIAEKMAAYIAGGMAPKTAARFTMGELSAIYRGRHYTRDITGSMRPTEPPENISPDEAKIKCKTAIKEILNICVEMKENGPPSDAGRVPTEIHNKVPKKPAQHDLIGFDKMAEYARKPA
jgi:hypothetical protein